MSYFKDVSIWNAARHHVLGHQLYASAYSSYKTDSQIIGLRDVLILYDGHKTDRNKHRAYLQLFRRYGVFFNNVISYISCCIRDTVTSGRKHELLAQQNNLRAVDHLSLNAFEPPSRHIVWNAVPDFRGVNPGVGGLDPLGVLTARKYV